MKDRKTIRIHKSSRISSLARKVLIRLWRKAPDFLYRNGIRIAGAESLFLSRQKKLGIPVVRTHRTFSDSDPSECRTSGSAKRRQTRNLAVQNAD